MSATEHHSRSRTFTAERTSARSTREWVGQTLAEWEYPQESIDDAQIVVSELAGNAIRYGEGNLYRIRLRREQGCLLIEVADDSVTRPIMRTSDDSCDETGRGLIVVDGLTLSWGTSPSDMGLTKIVWARLPEATDFATKATPTAAVDPLTDARI